MWETGRALWVFGSVGGVLLWKSCLWTSFICAVMEALKNPWNTQWICSVLGKSQLLYMGLALTCLSCFVYEIGMYFSRGIWGLRTRGTGRYPEKHAWKNHLLIIQARAVGSRKTVHSHIVFIQNFVGMKSSIKRNSKMNQTSKHHILSFLAQALSKMYCTHLS